jgi:hypothetical protein
MPAENKGTRPETTDKKMKSPNIAPETIKKKTRNDLETPMKDPRMQLEAVSATTGRKKNGKNVLLSAKKQEKIRTPSDSDLLAQLTGILGEPSDLDLSIEQFLRKMMSNRLSAFEQQTSAHFASFEASIMHNK